MYKYLYIGELLYIIHGIKYCIDKHSTKPDYLHIPALYRFNNNRYKIRGFCAYREIQRHFKHGSTPPPTQSKKRMHTNLNCFTKSLENIFRNDQLQITNSSATIHDKNKIKVDDFSFHCFLLWVFPT